MDRVFAKLTLKTVDEDQRVVEGWCSTNAIDRENDILEPLGAEWDLDAAPVPFLMDHDHRECAGIVEALEASAKGIRFRARLPRITEPGPAKDLVDRYWGIIRAGLRRSISVGFRPIAGEPRKEGGWRWTRWALLEVSAVTVPANPEAQITAVRAIAARGTTARPGPKVTGSSGRAVKLGNGSSSSKSVSKGYKLTPADKVRGRILAEAKLRAKARARAGIPLPKVKLTADDTVAAVTAAVRAKLRADKIRKGTRLIAGKSAPRPGVVRLRP